jgi:hypothetical protein
MLDMKVLEMTGRALSYGCCMKCSSIADNDWMSI